MAAIIAMGFVIGTTFLITSVSAVGTCVSPWAGVLTGVGYLAIGFFVGLHLNYRFGRHIKLCTKKDCFYCEDHADTWVVASNAWINWPVLLIITIIRVTIVPVCKGIFRLYEKVGERGLMDGERIRASKNGETSLSPKDLDVVERADRLLKEMDQREP